MHLTPGCGCIGFLSPRHKKIPDSYSKRQGGNLGNSGLSSQVVHYPRTVWKNIYAEHEVTGKTYNILSIQATRWDCSQQSLLSAGGRLQLYLVAGIRVAQISIT